MTVTVTDTLAGPYYPNGVTTSFGFDFKVASASEIRVFRRLLGVNTTVSSGSYTVSIAGDGEGGSVVFSTAPTSADGALYISGEPAFTQAASFSNIGFLPSALNPQFDRSVLRDIWLLNNMVRVPHGEAGLELAQSIYDLLAAGDIEAFRGIQGVPGSGNVIGFSVDDYCEGDGVTNDTAGFQALAADVIAAGGGVIDFGPGKTYIAGLNIPQTPEETAINFYTFLPSDILKFEGCTKPIVIRGNGARMKAPDGYKFGTFDADGNPTSHTLPYTGPEIAAAYYGMLAFHECTGGVWVENIELDGNVLNAEVGGGWGDTGYQLPGSGVQFYDCGFWRCRRVVAHGHPLDGFYVSDPGTLTTPPLGSGTEDCDSYENGRQGLSIVGGVGHVFVRSGFRRTRRNTGVVVSAPGACVDLEAEGTKIVRHIRFVDCDLSDSVGPCLLDGSSLDAHHITVRGGRIVGTSQYAYYGAGAEHVRFEGVRIIGSVVNLRGGADGKGEVFEDCLLTNDPSESPDGATVYSPSNFIISDGVAGVTVRGGEIRHAVAGTSTNANFDAMLIDGVTLRTTAAAGNLVVYGRYINRCRLIAEGGTIGSPGGLTGSTSVGHAENIWTYETGGTTTVYPATLSESRDYIGLNNNGADANDTLTVLTDKMTQRYTGTLTADRTITLDTTGARAGNRFRILRTGGGAFNLNVGSVKALATNQWCEVEFDTAGSWRLTAFGSL